MKDLTENIIALTLLVAACCLTWVAARSTVAVECERLGAFYVGDKTFTCQPKPKDKP